MKECWTEGELRAYCDRELPGEQQARIESHLQSCAECAALHRKIAERAAWVADLISALPEPSQAPVCPVIPIRKPSRWPRVAAIIGGIAAGLAVGSLLVPNPHEPGAPPMPAPPPMTSAQVVEEPVPVVTVTPPAPRAPVRRAHRASMARPAVAATNYLALDDDPIDTGVVMRVTLRDNVLADVIYSVDGRPRAIRLVSEKGSY